MVNTRPASVVVGEARSLQLWIEPSTRLAIGVLLICSLNIKKVAKSPATFLFLSSFTKDRCLCKCVKIIIPNIKA